MNKITSCCNCCNKKYQIPFSVILEHSVNIDNTEIDPKLFAELTPNSNKILYSFCSSCFDGVVRFDGRNSEELFEDLKFVEKLNQNKRKARLKTIFLFATLFSIFLISYLFSFDFYI